MYPARVKGKKSNQKSRSLTGSPEQTHRIAPPVKQIADDDSDSESIITCFSQKTNRSSVWRLNTKIKSGYLDKPRTSVVVKHEWLHMNQDPRYITDPLTFNQLNFPQFVGGECRTILKTENPAEQFGRLRVLAKIAYLYNQCGSWEKARSAYFAIVGSIEEGEAEWTNSFSHYDLMCPAPAFEYREKFSSTKSKIPQKRDYFCKEYQRGDCSQPSPHRAWIRSSMEMVKHFCANCFRARFGKLTHTPGLDGCVKK